MTEAMDRDVSVNGIHGSAPRALEQIIAAQAGSRPAAPASDEGPCLYFGPAGERCGRRAVHDGFCSQHQGGASPIVSRNSKKAMAAAVAIIGLLLPYLIDLLRELARILPR
jgi:hypothetical protein